MTSNGRRAGSHRRRRGGARIDDVAALAGVSPMTVSRVINGGVNVRRTTREAVEKAIAELNYSPDMAARRLAGGGGIRIGLLYSNPSAAYLSEFLVGSLDEAQREGVHLIVEKCDPEQNEIDALKHLLASRIDGLILPPPLCNMRSILEFVRSQNIPAVAVASGSAVDGLNSVSVEDFAAARSMTAHLLALGHRRIGFIEGSPDQTASASRRDGYEAALNEAGVAVNPELIVPGLFTYRSGLEAAERLLALPEPPAAIFASNDDMAVAAVAVAHRKGIKVPQELSVCGFDDTSLATAIWPALTTIRQPIAEMSSAALKLLTAEIVARQEGKPFEPTHLTLDFSLIRRETDAPYGQQARSE